MAAKKVTRRAPARPAKKKQSPRRASKKPRGFHLRHTLEGHERWINRIAWSPDGNKIASTSYDRTVRIWCAETGKLIRKCEPDVGSALT